MFCVGHGKGWYISSSSAIPILTPHPSHREQTPPSCFGSLPSTPRLNHPHRAHCKQDTGVTAWHSFCVLTQLLSACESLAAPLQEHLWFRRDQWHSCKRLRAASGMNFDEILCLIGGFGKFQKILYIWICLPQIFLAFHMLVSIFTGAVPSHFCRSSWPSAGTPASSNVSLPTALDSQPKLSCMVALNHSGALTPDNGHLTGSCQGGWEYSTETFTSTIVTEVSKKPIVWLMLRGANSCVRFRICVTVGSGDKCYRLNGVTVQRWALFRASPTGFVTHEPERWAAWAYMTEIRWLDNAGSHLTTLQVSCCVSRNWAADRGPAVHLQDSGS